MGDSYFDTAYCDTAYWDGDLVVLANTLFSEVIAEMEKVSVSTNWINYQWIKPGLADHTVADEVLSDLEK